MTKELKAIRDALERLIHCGQKQGFNDGYATEMDDARQALTTLDSIMADGGWQDISTAPKDGTTILGTNGEWIHTVYWSNYRHTEDNYWNSGGIPFKDATHWMPIPAAPKHGGEDA